MVDVDAYLARIGFSGKRANNAASLRAIHRAAVIAIPFENLDVHLGRPIPLDAAAAFAKVVHQRRGGFCHELNLLMGEVLRELGFDVTLMSARVCDGDGVPGREFAHMFNLVDVDGERWISDVGFGDSCVEPLRLHCDQVQRGGLNRYVVECDGKRGKITRFGWDGVRRDRYCFELVPRIRDDFAPMCLWQQMSEESTFVRSRMCIRATPEGGQLSIRDRALWIIQDGRKDERPIADDEAFSAALAEWFDIHIPPDAWKLPLQAAP